ncbi:MAG: sarcosine oxidase subunit delta [Acidimicrobiia bacterium]|nr:sarcosine oxidase subunit delta [Acidimicrobiia bacterium]MDH5295229.1 sarcosine oxidase subunit delta [Acidimicrobiia bacterium]
MKLTCPNCGTRSVEEFRYGEIPRVPDHITDPDARDLDRVFMKANAHGTTVEAWFHDFGCRRWFRLERDTRG